MVHYTIDDMRAEGECVIAVGSSGWINKRNGCAVETPKTDVSTFRNGRAVISFERFDAARFVAAAA